MLASFHVVDGQHQSAAHGSYSFAPKNNGLMLRFEIAPNILRERNRKRGLSVGPPSTVMNSRRPMKDVI
jgi:hypothetical protein